MKKTLFAVVVLLLVVIGCKKIRCSLACSQQQNTPNQNSHCFSVVFSRHHAIAVLPKVAKASLSCLLFWSRACVTSAYFVLQVASFITLRRRPFHWARLHFTHFSHFQSTGCPLFSSPALSFGLRSMGAYFLPTHIPR